LNPASQPIDWHGVWLTIKSVAEFIYFLTGIVLVGAAIYAARQVKFAAQQAMTALDQLEVTRKIAKDNAKREAVRWAGDHCRYFAEVVVPAWGKADLTYTKSECTFLDPVPIQPGAPQVPAFIINNGDFAPQVNYDINRISNQCWLKTGDDIVNFLNKLESFAIPFAMGVADDATGFQETAPAFINILNKFTPAIYYLRRTQGVRFPSILKLFNVWHNRVIANALAQMMPGMQKMIEDAGNEIPPL
jgi:hypothetical protein